MALKLIKIKYWKTEMFAQTRTSNTKDALKGLKTTRLQAPSLKTLRLRKPNAETKRRNPSIEP